MATLEKVRGQPKKMLEQIAGQLDRQALPGVELNEAAQRLNRGRDQGQCAEPDDDRHQKVAVGAADDVVDHELAGKRRYEADALEQQRQEEDLQQERLEAGQAAPQISQSDLVDARFLLEVRRRRQFEGDAGEVF